MWCKMIHIDISVYLEFDEESLEDSERSTLFTEAAACAKVAVFVLGMWGEADRLRGCFGVPTEIETSKFIFGHCTLPMQL